MSVKFFGAVVALALALSGCIGRTDTTKFISKHTVTVSGNQTLASRIDAGNYDIVDLDIQDKFKVEPIVSNYQAKMVVVSFAQFISSEHAVMEMRRFKLRPANLAECLAYGAETAKARAMLNLIPFSYSTVCLGSQARVFDTWRVPILKGTNGDWELTHVDWTRVGRPDHRYLAVRL